MSFSRRHTIISTINSQQPQVPALRPASLALSPTRQRRRRGHFSSSLPTADRSWAEGNGSVQLCAQAPSPRWHRQPRLTAVYPQQSNMPRHKRAREMCVHWINRSAKMRAQRLLGKVSRIKSDWQANKLKRRNYKKINTYSLKGSSLPPLP